MILLVSVTAAIASIASNAAFATGFISIAAAVTCVSPLVSILIGRIFLHEKMIIQQYIGAVVIVVGLVGISIV
jgi:drug/metabolite transporter (DMT)-like permease